MVIEKNDWKSDSFIKFSLAVKMENKALSDDSLYQLNGKN